MTKKQSKARVITVIVLVVVLAGAIIAAVIFGKRDNAVAVTVEPVGRRTITQTVSATGKIQPETQVKISSETSGEIIFLGVKEGDTVRKGQLLVRIKPDIVETQLAQNRAAAEAARANVDAARAELDRAQENLDRITALYQKKYASQEELEQARANVNQRRAMYEASSKNYEQSRAALSQVQVQAGRTSIYAPIDGIVTSLFIEAGEKVVGTAQMQGTEILRISDLNVMNALVDVDENDVVLISIGDTARVEIDAFPKRRFNGVVYQIGNAAKTSSLGTQDEVVNFEVRVRLIDLDSRLRPGMSCNADIETDTRSNVLAVPLQAVTVRTPEQDKEKEQPADDEQKPAGAKRKLESVVFINDNGKARMVPVTTGISDNGYIEIESGLSEGTSVVTGSFQAITKELEDGTVIKVNAPAARKTAAQ